MIRTLTLKTANLQSDILIILIMFYSKHSPGEGHDEKESRFIGGNSQDARLPGGPSAPHRLGENPGETVLHCGGKPTAHC